MQPTHNIPAQLRRYDFKFYLCGSPGSDWQKTPIEKLWNSTCNYRFFDDKLLNHRGNYGIVCGIGRLIVLDFDDLEFYNTVKDKLPKTFVVHSATKRMPHYYYLLKEDMIAKVNILDTKDKRTLMDVQAARSGVVAPNSIANRRYYDVVEDNDIAEISVNELLVIFPQFSVNSKSSVAISADHPRVLRRYTQLKTYVPSAEDNEAVIISKLYLSSMNVTSTRAGLYKCPFHAMSGHGNLAVMPNGMIYCFHEQKCWRSYIDFCRDVELFNNKRLK